MSCTVRYDDAITVHVVVGGATEPQSECLLALAFMYVKVADARARVVFVFVLVNCRDRTKEADRYSRTVLSKRLPNLFTCMLLCCSRLQLQRHRSAILSVQRQPFTIRCVVAFV